MASVSPQTVQVITPVEEIVAAVSICFAGKTGIMWGISVRTYWF